METVQEIYSDLKNGNPVDKNKYIDFIRKYGYRLDKNIDETIDVLSSEYGKMPDVNSMKMDPAVLCILSC